MSEPRFLPSRPDLRHLRDEAKRRRGAGEFPSLALAQLAIARRLAEWGDLVLCGYDDGSADRAGLRELGIDVRAVPRRLTPAGAARAPARPAGAAEDS